MNKKYISVELYKDILHIVEYVDGKKNIKTENSKRDVFVGSDFKPLIDLNQDGNKLKGKFFDSNQETNNYIKQNMFSVYGAPNTIVEYIKENYGDDNTITQFNYRDFNVQYFDIETTTENGFPDSYDPLEAITVVTFISPVTRKKTVFTTFNYTGKYLKEENIEIKMYDDERTMLIDIIKFIKTIDYIIGFNSEFFDIPYMISRMYKIVGKSFTESISPFGIITKSEKEQYGKKILTYKILGLVCLDYQNIFKKFTYGGRSSYSLDSICEEHLKSKKLTKYGNTFKEFYTGTFDVKKKPTEDEHPAVHLAYERYLYKRSGKSTNNEEYILLNNKCIQESINMFVEYNVMDVILLVDLDDVLKFLNLIGSISYMMKSNINDVLGTIRIWENKIYTYLSTNNMLPKINNPQQERESFPGGFVKDPIIGFHNWMITFDYTSLYPSIIMNCNISPETYIGNVRDLLGININSIDDLIERKVDLSFLRENNWCMTANGAIFSREKQGFIPTIVKTLFEQRKTVKGEMLKLKSEIEEYENRSKIIVSDIEDGTIEKELKRRGLYEKQKGV